MKLNAHKFGLAGALWLAVFFVICFVIWGNLVPSEYSKFHMDFMAVTYPGIDGMNLKSIIIGLVESLIYGYIGAGAFAYLYNKFTG